MSRRRKTKEKEEVEQAPAPPEPTGLMYQPFQVPQFDPSYQGAMNRYFKPVPEEDLKTDMKLITSGGKRPEVKVVLSALEESRMGRGKGKRSKRADQKKASAMDIERQKNEAEKISAEGLMGLTHDVFRDELPPRVKKASGEKPPRGRRGKGPAGGGSDVAQGMVVDSDFSLGGSEADSRDRRRRGSRKKKDDSGRWKRKSGGRDYGEEGPIRERALAVYPIVSREYLNDLFLQRMTLQEPPIGLETLDTQFGEWYASMAHASAVRYDLMPSAPSQMRPGIAFPPPGHPANPANAPLPSIMAGSSRCAMHLVIALWIFKQKKMREQSATSSAAPPTVIATSSYESTTAPQSQSMYGMYPGHLTAHEKMSAPPIPGSVGASSSGEIARDGAGSGGSGMPRGMDDGMMVSTSAPTGVGPRTSPMYGYSSMMPPSHTLGTTSFPFSGSSVPTSSSSMPFGSVPAVLQTTSSPMRGFPSAQSYPHMHPHPS